MDAELIRIFSEAGLRLTIPRITIFNTLKESGIPLSKAQIVRLCPNIDKASVYRTVQLFDSLNIVTTIMHGWRQSYELSSPFHPHHHHMMCEKCGTLLDLQSPSIEMLIQKLSKQHAFTATSHHFEIHGVCERCTTQP